jgi:carboxyl-terminal processing protease
MESTKSHKNEILRCVGPVGSGSVWWRGRVGNLHAIDNRVKRQVNHPPKLAKLPTYQTHHCRRGQGLHPAANACHAKNMRSPSVLVGRTLLAAMLPALTPVAGFAQPGSGPLSATQKQFQTDSFETVWSTIRDKHWDVRPGGLDWQAIHDEYRPLVDQAETPEQVRAVIRAMLARLKQTHFAILAPGVAEDIANEGGEGTPGFDVRILNGHVIVTEITLPETNRENQIHNGWEVLQAGKWDLPPLVEKLQADSAINEFAAERAIQSRLSGPVGASKHFVFLDGAGARIAMDLSLRAPRGELAGFGNLPAQRVWFEFRKIGNAGMIRFNEFLDLPRLMPAFGKAVEECGRCDGLIIDIRGNPGGIGGMAMGMAGWLTDRQNLQLGTMYMRGATLKFFINPREDAYTGPLAILVDATSASTSEIFAGGLQDLHRARVFGTHTAGAALPSVITRLPDGDGFQYAVANYISEGGRPLEGNGVTPDVEVRLTRESLLEGRDAVADAALAWIRQQGKQQGKRP